MSEIQNYRTVPASLDVVLAFLSFRKSYDLHGSMNHFLIFHGLVDIFVNKSLNFFAKMLVNILICREKNSLQAKMFNFKSYFI